MLISLRRYLDTWGGGRGPGFTTNLPTSVWPPFPCRGQESP
ncbi:hypothetical protein RRG08_061041 [Elysia crispata]|uniref:Uncharacterized protein n=1 Tax=Elysia crispata TaxID=231223 RepID=A0AAE1AVC5_9GAST|nr:hypothetical protein RRG08_061041 [Elysia crispata]